MVLLVREVAILVVLRVLGTVSKGPVHVVAASTSTAATKVSSAIILVILSSGSILRPIAVLLLRCVGLRLGLLFNGGNDSSIGHLVF